MEGGQGPQRGPIGGGMVRSDGVTRWPGGRNFSESLYLARFLRYQRFSGLNIEKEREREREKEKLARERATPFPHKP